MIGLCSFLPPNYALRASKGTRIDADEHGFLDWVPSSFLYAVTGVHLFNRE